MVLPGTARRGLFPALVCLALIAFLGASDSAGATKKRSGRGSREEPPSVNLIQSEAMSFADRYVVRVSHAISDLISSLRDTDSRAAAATWRSSSLAAVISAAAGSNPDVALLDLVVQVTLERKILETYFIPEHFGRKGEPLVELYRSLEEEIWEMAGELLTTEQVLELDRLIEDWWKENPDIKIVSFFRFRQFASARGETALSSVGQPRGMLRRVGEATRAIEEMQGTARRALFLIERMVITIDAQIEALFYGMATLPEVQDLLEGAGGVHASVDAMTDVLRGLPEQIEKSVANLARDEKVPGLAADLRRTVEAGSELAEKADTALSTAHALLKDLGPVGPDGQRRPVTVEELQTAALELQRTAEHLTELVEVTQKLLESPALQKELPELGGVVKEMEETGERIVDHLFGRALILIALALSGAVVAGLLYRFLASRLFPGS